MSDADPLQAAEVDEATTILDRIGHRFDATVVGQPMLRRALVVSLVTGGHVLLESVPGLAKTLAVSTLASSLDADFSRVQCTPDLLPSDIVGTQIFDPSSATFRTELGPVHAHFVLLDEINRSSAKTQSAMLEAMQERQVTIGTHTYPLPKPFIVLATQNPIDEEGTYVLPHAQMDRFLLKEVITYPEPGDELEMLHRLRSGLLDTAHRPGPVATIDDILRLQSLLTRVHVDESVLRYIVEIVHATRHPRDFLDARQARCIEYGSSPRGAIAFVEAACANALIAGRGYVVPDDVRSLRHAVLRHRLVLTFEAVAAQVSVESLVDAIFDTVPTP